MHEGHGFVQASPQRPGKLGVDYDELGAEMAPNARVWKKYVEETDRMDTELVEGWNSSLDIILIFAALFSAISTAFVIESSKDLKPDYTQTSAQTLQLMSQTLSAIARGAPLNDLDTMDTETQEFTPSSSAIAVNTLWFLSLGLSVAVSLIAILAKEWCHSFMAGRVGSMVRQARLRQQRWDRIEQRKMKEILYVLPLLMHTALLLFAVGLSLYLWDIDTRVALPVVITTSLAALFYVVTVSLPLFFQFCPYTTVLARFLYPYWLALLGNRHTMDSIGALIASLRWISYAWMSMKQIVNRRTRPAFQGPRVNNDIETTRDPQPHALPFLFRDTMQEVHAPIKQWVDNMQAMFSTQRSQLIEMYPPMDGVTSSMIAWMITNCEDSRSVDMALQALADADQTLPRLPLWECDAVDLLCQRIGDCCILLPRPSDGSNISQNTFLDNASLYSRSLCFLTKFIADEGLDMSDTSKPCFVVKDNHELAVRLQDTADKAQHYLRDRLDEILNCAWSLPTPRYDIVAYELNAVPVKASMDVWDMMERYREQCQKQQKLAQYITSQKVTDLPPGAVVAFIHGITKTYFYNTSQSPKLLIDLLQLLELPDISYISCRIPLAIGLTTAAFVTGDYFGEDNKEEQLPADESSLKRARNAYTQLTNTRVLDMEPSTLLHFALLSFLVHKTEGNWTFDTAEIELIGSQLGRCWNVQYYHQIVPGIPASFDGGHHLAQVLSKLISAISSAIELDGNTESLSPILSRIEVALNSPSCWENGDRIVPLLARHFASTGSVKLKILCLRGIHYSFDNLSVHLDVILDSFVHTGLLTRVLEVTTATCDDPTLTPYCMEFLWVVARELFYQTDEDILEPRRSFKIPSTENRLLDHRDELGLENLWLPKIDEICHRNPQSLLDSNLFSVMIKFYDYEEHRGLKPRTAGLPSAFDSTWTWLQVLQYWEKGCKEAVEKKAKTGLVLDEKAEAAPAVCGAGRHEGEGELCPDIHDWSI